MNSSFSMLFKPSYDETDQYHHQMVYPLGSPSSSVDCTLSLGTPSTRSGGGDQYDERRRGRSGSNFGCWDFLQGKSPSSSGSSGGGYNSHHSHKSGNSNNCGGGSNNVDPLLARRCANCDTTSTPLWRNGPRGPKSLCNACGIRFKKEERRATAATATATAPSGGFDSHYTYQNNSPWANNTPTTQKMPCFSPANEFRFIDDGDSGVPFLSWRLNVTDHRPTGLVHDFTR